MMKLYDTGFDTVIFKSSFFAERNRRSSVERNTHNGYSGHMTWPFNNLAQC